MWGHSIHHLYSVTVGDKTWSQHEHEDDPGDLVLPGVHKEQHVCDAQEGEQHQSGLHSLPEGEGWEGGPESQPIPGRNWSLALGEQDWVWGRVVAHPWNV